MVTFVGTQESFIDALKEVLEMEYEALDLYKQVIEKIENTSYKETLLNFQEDHQYHIQRLVDFLSDISDDIPQGAGAKGILEGGKWIQKSGI